MGQSVSPDREGVEGGNPVAAMSSRHLLTVEAHLPGEDRPMGRLHGIYRAVVVNAADPLRRSRVQVRVKDVLGTGVAWALPCVPVGSRAVPKVGAGIWVMFEGGDPDHPVWMGVLRAVPP